MDSFLQFHRFNMTMQGLAMASCESSNDKKEISWYTLILAFSPVGVHGTTSPQGRRN
jgi:hypothetical protein